LDIEFLDDGSALASTHPHLKVEATPDFIEDVMSGQLYWFWPWAALAFLGVVLLVVAAIRSWWGNRLVSGR